jgi:hypothetical protein
VATQRTRRRQRLEPSDPGSIERGVRQLLADKVSGTLVGIWLLVPEHLRLGTWDLALQWTRRSASTLEPRLVLQLIHESALCLAGVRRDRSLSQRGFELANGLPFMATDQAMHDLLATHTVAEAQTLQVGLGLLRRASGHYAGRLLAIDPHHMRSYSQRQTRRHRHKETEAAVKTSQTFFCLDADTGQPLAFTIGSSARTVSQATPELLDLAAAILQPRTPKPLVMADTEHCCAALFEQVVQQNVFDLLTPMPAQPALRTQMRRIPADAFTPHWAGFATTVLPYRFQNAPNIPLYQFVQRCGERNTEYHFKGFGCTRDTQEVPALIEDYPKRWHLEEFFNANQALGWKRAGTLNLNIRYGHMSMALIAQAALHQFRNRLGEPYLHWDAAHLARDLFCGLDGDIRVQEDTIHVTFYNAPNAPLLAQHYEHLPQKLIQDNIDPHIPWLYNFKLDFHFK